MREMLTHRTGRRHHQGTSTVRGSGSNVSMRSASGRRLACSVLLVVSTACAKPSVRVPATVPPGPTPTERLAAADRLVRAGCLDFLLDAFREYQSLRSIASAGHAAAMGAIRAGGLIALRQRELGMTEGDHLDAAKQIAASEPDLPRWIAGTLDVIDVLPASIGGVARPATNDSDLEKM